jgi:hypothetical protein
LFLCAAIFSKVFRLFSWWTFAAANISAALPLDLNGESHGKALCRKIKKAVFQVRMRKDILLR